jgi:hypothetical protein
MNELALIKELITQNKELVSLVQQQTKVIESMTCIAKAADRLLKAMSAEEKDKSEEDPLVIHGQGEYAKKIYPSDLE